MIYFWEEVASHNSEIITPKDPHEKGCTKRTFIFDDSCKIVTGDFYTVK